MWMGNTRTVFEARQADNACEFVCSLQMWQSLIEIEYCSVTFFDRITIMLGFH